MKLIDFPAVLTGLTKTYQRDITEIEKVHKRATKLTINLKNMSYTDRLLHLKLPTLKYRKLRGDMIEVFCATICQTVRPMLSDHCLSVLSSL